MLMSLISLSDNEIERVMAAVGQWCRENHCEVDSEAGRRALTTAIDLAQTQSSDKRIFTLLVQRLNPPHDYEDVRHGNATTIDNSRGTTPTGG